GIRGFHVTGVQTCALPIYTMASVGQTSAHFGSPPHRSHLSTLPVSGLKLMVPNGQAATQARQPTQALADTSLAPVNSLRLMASTGQACMHHASSHWVQVYGTLRRPCSNSEMRMRERAGLNSPVCSKEHAISHCRQPVHLSGSI